MTVYHNDIEVGTNLVFRSLSSKEGGEVCGWIERDHELIAATYGFYRTSDPKEASRRALLALEGY